MDMLSPSRVRDKLPLKDVTNSTPTPAAALAAAAAAAAAASSSPRKTISNKRNKRTNSISIATPPPAPPQRRSTRLSSLKTEPRDADGGETEPQSSRVTRSRRKAPFSDSANGGGSVTTTRKRSGRKEPAGEGSVTITRRTRTSTSAVPSSPLDQKSRLQEIMQSTPSRPRLSPANSTAARTEASGMKCNKTGVRASNETELENQPVNPRPLLAYTMSQISEYFATPFKQYPFPASPLKALTPKPSNTPSFAKSPLPSFPCLKPTLPENDIFAISPGMFPRRTKQMDFLDILEDAERKDFESPSKSSPVLTMTLQEQPCPVPTLEEQRPQITLDNEDDTDDVAAEIYRNPEERKGTVLQLEEISSQVLNPVQDDEEHPHFALLAYLADLASVRDPVPEGLHPIEEEVTHGSLEDILTAAAVAESIQDQIFVTEDVEVIAFQPREEGVEVDIMNITEDALKESSEVPPELSRAVQNQQTPPGSPRPTSALVRDTVEESIHVSSDDDGLTIDEPAKLEDEDSQSLISYSEAEITMETAIVENIQEVDVRTDFGEVEGTDLVTPADTVDVHETGQFIVPTVHISEGQIPSDNLPMSRQSLDNSVIFSFSTEQIVIPSPPKTQISANIFGDKKRKTGLSITNTTRLDILRKRASRNRSREARHNLKRRDITAALQPILDNIPSPVAVLHHPPVLAAPGLVVKRLQSPVTPTPAERPQSQEETLLLKRVSPIKGTSPKKEQTISAREQIMIHATPIQATPKMEFQFQFPNLTRDKTPTVPEQAIKPTLRHEVYSKVFGPPAQLPTNLVEKESLTIKSDLTITLTGLRAKSPAKKRKDTTEIDLRPAKKREVEPLVSTLGKPVRNDSFAVPAVPVPPGPPQLPPSIQRSNGKRFTSLNAGILPSPAAPGSFGRSTLPRPPGTFGSGLPVPAKRRSTRDRTGGVIQGPKSVPPPVTNAPAVTQSQVVVLEKKTTDAVPVEKLLPPPVIPETIPHIENITIDRPKGKLGGAQRVNRNGELKRQEEAAAKATRPTRPATPPLTSLSQKELKSLTDTNTKKNDGFKTVMLQPTVKRVNKKRPGEASDDFMVGRGAKWSKCDAELPEWDREFAAVEERTRIKWKSPKFMARTERKGPMRVKGILKKKEKERDDGGDTGVGTVEPLVIQRFVYKGEKL